MSDVFSTLDALPMERGDLDNAVGKLGELPTLIAVVGSSGKSIASCALSSILSGQGKGVGLFLHCLPSDADRIYKEKIKFDEEQYNRALPLVRTQLKALIARDLWDMSEYYQVMNATNESVQQALKVLREGKYLF